MELRDIFVGVLRTLVEPTNTKDIALDVFNVDFGDNTEQHITEKLGLTDAPFHKVGKQ